MPEAFLVGGVRTPQGKYGGALAGVRPDDLAALVVGEAVRRGGVPAEAVDEVVLGAANQAGEDNRNVARMAVLLAGLPETVPGVHGEPALRERPDRDRLGRAGGPLRRGRPDRRRRRRVDDPRAVGDGQAGHAVGPARRGGRHVAGLAVHQPAVRAAAETADHAQHGRDRRGGRRPGRHHAGRTATRSRCAATSGPSPRSTRAGSPARSSRSARSPSTRSRAATPAWRSWPRCKPVFRAGGVVTAGSSSPLSDGAAAVVVASRDGDRAVRADAPRPHRHVGQRRRRRRT